MKRTKTTPTNTGSVIKLGDTDEIFIDLIGDLGKMEWAEMKELAEAADVSPNTLYNWTYGATCNPHLNTVKKVSKALGYQLALVKPEKRKGRAPLKLVVGG